jgi:hypothetical protein
MNTEQRLNDLERRLQAAERRAARAERRATRLLYAAVAGCSLIGGLACWQVSAAAQAAKTKPLNVTKLTAPVQVVDQRGSIMLMVESAKPGPRLQLYGSTGRPIAEFAMSEQGGGQVTVFDRAGKPAFTQPAPPKK